MTGRNADADRSEHDDAYVWITPARQGGEPCVGGTRIPTSLIAHLVIPTPGVNDAEDIEDICRDYNLTRPQVICALWWEYGHRFDRRTKRGRWLTAAHSHLARLGKTDDPGEFV